MGTKNNPGKYDCYAKAAPDEPIFTLRASDPHAPDVVRQWARVYLASQNGLAPVDRRDDEEKAKDKHREAMRCAEAMELYYTEVVCPVEDFDTDELLHWAADHPVQFKAALDNFERRDVPLDIPSVIKHAINTHRDAVKVAGRKESPAVAPFSAMDRFASNQRILQFIRSTGPHRLRHQANSLPFNSDLRSWLEALIDLAFKREEG